MTHRSAVAFVRSKIAPASEGIELSEQIRIDPQSERQALQCNRVVSRLVGAGAVAPGAQRHRCNAQQRLVGGGKTSFRAECCDLRVLQAPFDAAQQPLDFVALCGVPMQLSDLD